VRDERQGRRNCPLRAWRASAAAAGARILQRRIL